MGRVPAALRQVTQTACPVLVADYVLVLQQPHSAVFRVRVLVVTVLTTPSNIQIKYELTFVEVEM